MRNVRWMRRLLGIVLGVGAALLLLWSVEAAGQFLYPFQRQLETFDRAELAAVIAGMPMPAKLIVVAGWFTSAFGGAWLALRVCDWGVAGWIVVTLVVAGNVATLAVLPHPLWLQIAAIVAPLAGGWIARRAHHKPYKGEPLIG